MTHLERQLLRFIEQYLADHDGVAPTLAEMASAVGVASKSGAHRLLESLERQQLIRREPRPATCIDGASAGIADGRNDVADFDVSNDDSQRLRSIDEGDDGSYEILSVNADPEGQAWAYSTGDIVRVEEHTFMDGKMGLVACEKLG